MKPLILGIDAGKSGGFAEIWPNGKVDAFPMFEDDDLRDYIQSIAKNASIEGLRLICYLEQVGGYIGRPQSGHHMFNFGSNYGFLRGLLAANRIETVLVRPQKWSKDIASVQGLKGPDRKRALRNEAARLFPNIKITLSTCDALLIARYGCNQTT